MGCCASRETFHEQNKDELLREQVRSRENMTKLETELGMVALKVEGIRRRLEAYQKAIGERRELARITAILDQIELDVRAQVISDLHSTNLAEEELRESVRLHHINKHQDSLQHWILQAEIHLRTTLSLRNLQRLQADLMQLLSYLRAAHSDFQKSHETLQRKIASSVKLDFESWHRQSDRLNRSFLELIMHTDALNQQISTNIIKLRETLSDEKLSSCIEDVKSYLTLLQTEFKPLGRKSYREISEEVLHFENLTRTSTSDSLAQFERLLTKVHTAGCAPMSTGVWTDLANRLVELLARKNQAYREKRETVRPREMDIVEYFLEKYKEQAATAIQAFAKTLEVMKEHTYVSFLSRALCFSPSRHLHFFPELILRFQSLSHDFDWETGGLLPLKSLISTIESLFSSHPDLGSAVMHQMTSLLPDPLSFALFYIQEKQLTAKISAFELFHDLDLRGKQALVVSEFAKTLKKRFKLMILDEDLTDLGESLDLTHSGSIFRTTFLQVFEQKVDNFDIKLSEVLQMFETAYDEIQAEQTYSLYQLFSEESGPDYRPEISQIIPIFQKIRPGLSENTVNAVLNKVKLQYAGQMTFEEFREVVWRFDLKLPEDCVLSVPLGEKEQVEVSEDLHNLILTLST